MVVDYFPYMASDLTVCQQTIRDSQRKFAGMAWYAYDIAFRKQVENDKSISWANRDTQLYLKFTGLATQLSTTMKNLQHRIIPNDRVDGHLKGQSPLTP